LEEDPIFKPIDRKTERQKGLGIGGAVLRDSLGESKSHTGEDLLAQKTVRHSAKEEPTPKKCPRADFFRKKSRANVSPGQYRISFLQILEWTIRKYHTVF
jgi:hypothetical protein